MTEPKEMGIFVDAFPVEYISENQKGRLPQYLENRFNSIFECRMSGSESYSIADNNIKRNMKRIVFFPEFVVNRLKYGSMNNRLSAIQNELRLIKDTENCGVVYSRYKEREIVNSSIFKNYIYLEFENRKYQVVKDYLLYLNTTFGETYMELPAEADRETHSFYSFYWGK